MLVVVVVYINILFITSTCLLPVYTGYFYISSFSCLYQSLFILPSKMYYGIPLSVHLSVRLSVHPSTLHIITQICFNKSHVILTQHYGLTEERSLSILKIISSVVAELQDFNH